MPTLKGTSSLQENPITANLLSILSQSNLKYFEAGAY